MSNRPFVLVADRGRSLVPADQTILVREEVEVRAAKTAAAILAIVREAHPNLIVLGPDLEDMTALDLCRRLRDDDSLRHVSILLVASPVERERVESILKAGANDVLYRPLSPEEFDAKVGRLLTVPARRGFRALVQFQVDANREGFFHLGRSRNISITGMLLETERALAIGERLELRFFLPGLERELHAQAEVVRSTAGPFATHQFGIRFVELGSAEREAVKTFVERLRAST